MFLTWFYLLIIIASCTARRWGEIVGIFISAYEKLFMKNDIEVS